MAKRKIIQPEVNVGLIGHVDHGKTTLTERLTGKWADTHSEEIKRGITIRLGYADTTLRKCKKCEGPDAYTVHEKCETCGGATEEIKRISIVDAPGHESLMATMLSGATMMDGALLLVAANETCPQPQTREHIMGLQIIGIKNIIVIQNKIDLVSRERAKKNYEQIRKFLEEVGYKDAPIIPVSAVHNVNVGAVIEAIDQYIPKKERNPEDNPLMFVSRSFDINRPGADISKLKGGVLGGSLVKGILKKDQEVEIRPGIRSEEKNQAVWKPIKTKIVSLASGNDPLEQVGPGGSIALATSLDPAIVKSDQLAGAAVGLPEHLPEVRYQLKLETHLLERVVGSKEEKDVEPIKKGETLMLNVNTAATVGVVTSISKNFVECKLKLPVCAEAGSRVTISRLIGSRFRLIGYGIINE
ncbi:MAG: translation initiation factor IF-2 subunit gamma [Candidatus Nanoarchaeia archaeon]